MLRTVIFTERAYLDIERIYYFYENAGVPVHGSRIEAELLRASRETLRYQPGIGKPLRKGPPPVRAYLIMRSHWIVYAYSETHLTILRLFSAKEDQFGKLRL